MKYLIIVLVITFISCSTENTYRDVEVLYDSQFFQLDLSKNTTIKTKAGLEVVFTSKSIESILELDGNSAIEIEVLELYSKIDFAINNLPTLDVSGNHLESAGMFKIVVSQNKVPINVPFVEIKTTPNYWASRDTINYRIYEGQPQDGKMAWADPKKINNIFTRDTTSQMIPLTSEGSDSLIDLKPEVIELLSFEFQLDLKTLNWINIDRLLNSSTEETELAFTISDEFTNIHLGLVLGSTNSYLPLYLDKASNTVKISLPINEQADLLAFSFDDNKYYLARKEISSGTKNQIELMFKEIDINDLRNK